MSLLAARTFPQFSVDTEQLAAAAHCRAAVSPGLSPSAGPRLDSVFLVFEYCPHDMGKLVDSLPKPFHESEVKCLMQQVGGGEDVS